MYTAFFGLREKPFSLSPDPRFLFLSGAHREALAHLLYGIEQGEGFIAVTGEVGTGKTTLCRTLLRRLPSDVDTAFLFNPKLGAHELLEALLQEFEIKCETPSPRALINALNEFLLEKRREGRRVLLILDEAQGLEFATLEQVRLLSNLETERAKLLQILMLGQPELDEMLATPALRQLRQRIGVRWRLSALTREEADDYIAHRLRIAAGGDRNLFSPGALRAIHARSGGIPRRINLLCDRALLAAYGRGAPMVTRSIAITAARELDGAPLHHGWRRAAVIVGGALALAAGIIATGAFDWRHESVAPTARTEAPARGVDAAVSAAPPADRRADETRASKPADAPIFAAVATSAEPSLLRPVLPPDPFELAVLADPSPETLRRASLVLFRSWQLHPTPASLGGDLDAILQRATGLGLQVHSRDDLGLGQLRELGHPALVRLAGGHIVGLRAVRGDAGSLIAIVGFGDAPLWVPAELLEKHWSGEAHVFWRDMEGLPPLMAPTQRGPGVRWLQGMLVELGYLAGEPSGYFDTGTATALRAFQGDYALSSDGRVGPRTKIALYHALSRYEIPRLTDSVDR